jgi:branched-subunit amino acid transport protein
MIESSSFWFVLACLICGTLAIRGSLIAASTRVNISERAKEIFTFIPAAILPAFIAPFAFFHEGQVAWMQGKERFLVLVLATAVCMWTRSTLVTICFGLSCLYVITQFLA